MPVIAPPLVFPARYVCTLSKMRLCPARKISRCGTLPSASLDEKVSSTSLKQTPSPSSWIGLRQVIEPPAAPCTTVSPGTITGRILPSGSAPLSIVIDAVTVIGLCRCLRASLNASSVETVAPTPASLLTSSRWASICTPAHTGICAPPTATATAVKMPNDVLIIFLISSSFSYTSLYNKRTQSKRHPPLILALPQILRRDSVRELKGEPQHLFPDTVCRDRYCHHRLFRLYTLIK